MAIVTPTTPEVVRDIVDNAEERELYIVSKEMEREPYWFAHEGMNARLAKALRRCLEGGIERLPNGDHVVKGSAGRLYIVTGRECACPASQKGKSSWCYHRVTVALYTEWQRRLHPAQPAPVVPGLPMSRAGLGTLRTGTLPLPPVTADERLASSSVDDPPHTPLDDTRPGQAQEDRMADDDTQYIPDPDDAPAAVLEPPDTTAATPRPLPGPVLLPSLDARTLEQSMQAWAAQRQVIKRFLQQELVEGTDFYTLRIKGRETKPALSKAGSEKFMALFQLHASFAQDTATWTMLGEPQGTLCYVCTLHTRSGEIVGEGRGARTVQQDGGDINKAVKMAQKSSCVDAILRTGALSDVFTQDLEPETAPEPVKPVPPARPTGQEYRQRIWAMVKGQAPDVTTREQVERWIKAETGYTLHPDHYQDIIESLMVRA